MDRLVITALREVIRVLMGEEIKRKKKRHRKRNTERRIEGISWERALAFAPNNIDATAVLCCLLPIPPALTFTAIHCTDGP